MTRIEALVLPEHKRRDLREVDALKTCGVRPQRLRARRRFEVRESVQVVSGIAREEAVGRPPTKEGTMSTALQDPPTRLLNLPSPPVGAPSEPVKPPGPFSFDTGDTGRLLERLERLRSTAAGNSPHAPEAPSR
jgi:hypothetical protein